MISLLPFPLRKISTKGLNWELFNEELSLTKRVGTRNFARENTVEITYENGDVLILSETKFVNFNSKSNLFRIFVVLNFCNK